tara:strand:+ start:218 stop:925 length:708 start_codon:yes stop_codon:yes gene_type:complete
MYKNKKILAITLARGGSKAIKNKNIINLNKKPLISYTINEAKKSRYIDEYIISTDSIKIKKIALKFGAKVPFMRPKKYSTDKATSVDALVHAVKWVELNNKTKYDYIIELMCTNPLKKVEDIDKIIRKIVNTNADSVIAIHKLEDHHPIRIKKIVNDKIVDFILKEIPETRRQDLKPIAFIRSGSIYALKRQHLMIEKLRYGSNNSRPYILPENRAINIDTIADLYAAEKIIADG